MRCFKILTLFLGSFVVMSACAQRVAPPAPSAPVPPPDSSPARAAFVTWDKSFIALGKVKKGEKREMFFEFVNTFGQDIKIDIVDACECTTLEFPRGVIRPGHKGRIEAIFDSKDKTEDETIEIRVIFENANAEGIPYIETLRYSFELAQ